MKVIYLIVFFIIIVIKAFSQVDQFSQGDFLLEKGYYKEATLAYSNYLEVYPRDVKGNLKLAQCYLFLNKEEEAKKPLFIAFELSKRITYEMYFIRGLYFQLCHEYTKALKDFENVPITANPHVIKKITECKSGIRAIKKPIDVKIINLGMSINSSENDVLPKVTADNRQLYFSSYRGGIEGDRRYPMDIYYSKKEGEVWGEVNKLGKPINTNYNEACVGVSADGLQMFLYRGDNGGDLYVSRLIKGSWSVAVPCPFNTDAKESSMTISPDGQELLFVRREKGTTSRLYSCYLQVDSSWSPPKISDLDSPYDEETPFFHADGKTVFFSSKGEKTIGGYDIMYAKRTTNGWSSPKSLGYPLNTAKDELGFVLTANGQVGYYSSLRDGGVGDQDLYEIAFNSIFFDSQMVLLSGVIVDMNDRPLDASLVVVDLNSQKIISHFMSNTLNGEYLLPLEAGREYAVRVEKKGYLFYSQYVYIGKGSGYHKYVYNIQMKEEKKTERVILRNVFFVTGKSELDAKSEDELLQLVELLESKKGVGVQITGHTDNLGKEEKNLLLSQNRAESVKAFLIIHGIDQSRVVTKGYGSRQPITNNKTNEGRNRNRRTEFELIDF